MYQYVTSHFNAFLHELQLADKDRIDALGKAERIAKSLFANYYPNLLFNPSSHLVVGSLGKGTAIRPRTDLDMIFVLPWQEYSRIEALSGNKQSALLQEVKRVLLGTFPTTGLSADGQVVVARFQTCDVDVVPAFRFDDGKYLIAHTGEGGLWRLSNPVAEYNCLKRVDAASYGKGSDLVRMLKAWKRECSVEMKSVCLEIAATVFVDQWPHRAKASDTSYHDHMVRDFFAFLLNYVNGSARPAGIDRWIPLGDCWQSKCQSAYNRAVKACAYEQADDGLNACLEWQKVFGYQLSATPHYVSLLTAMTAVR